MTARVDRIDGTELGAEGFLALAERALELRAGASPRRFPGRRIVAVYLNSSLRTRVSLEAAANDLGVHVVTLNPGADAWKLEWREGARMDGEYAEHFADAIPALGEFADILALRAFAGLKDADRRSSGSGAHRLSTLVARPVISLESARWHPLQALADAATWRHHLGPQLLGRKIALTWAPHPRALPAAVPNQIVLSAGLLGLDLTVAHPPGFDLDPEVTARASALARAAGGALSFTDDPDAAMAGAEVVHAKSWSGFSGYGRRDDEAAIGSTLGAWTLDEARFARARPDAGFMHCLPVRRNVVVTDAVIDGPRSWTTETAGNRRWTAMALLEQMFSAML